MDAVEAAYIEIAKSIPKDKAEYWDGYRKALSTFEKAIRKKMSETKEHERKCWDCGNIATHSDNITPEVNCKKCGSQDTRRVKK